MLKSVLVRNKENGEAMICWNNQLRCYTIYSLTWSARLDTFEQLNSYCSQSRYQPLLLLYDREELSCLCLL